MTTSVEVRNVMPRRSVQTRDPQSWRATLAAAERVMGYYASKAERGTVMRGNREGSPSMWSDLAPASRLAA